MSSGEAIERTLKNLLDDDVRAKYHTLAEEYFPGCQNLPTVMPSLRSWSLDYANEASKRRSESAVLVLHHNVRTAGRYMELVWARSARDQSTLLEYHRGLVRDWFESLDADEREEMEELFGAGGRCPTWLSAGPAPPPQPGSATTSDSDTATTSESPSDQSPVDSRSRSSSLSSLTSLSTTRYSRTTNSVALGENATASPAPAPTPTPRRQTSVASSRGSFSGVEVLTRPKRKLSNPTPSYAEQDDEDEELGEGEGRDASFSPVASSSAMPPPPPKRLRVDSPQISSTSSVKGKQRALSQDIPVHGPFSSGRLPSAAASESERSQRESALSPTPVEDLMAAKEEKDDLKVGQRKGTTSTLATPKSGVAQTKEKEVAKVALTYSYTGLKPKMRDLVVSMETANEIEDEEEYLAAAEEIFVKMDKLKKHFASLQEMNE